MTLRVRRFRLFLVVFAAGCTDAPPVAQDIVTETGTDRMVELLAQIAAGIDRQQSQYAASAQVEALLARGPEPGLRGLMTFKGQLSEMLLHAGRFQEATDSLQSLLDAADASGGRVPAEFRQVMAELQASALLKWEEQLDCVEAREFDRCLLPVVDQPRSLAAVELACSFSPASPT